jgi:membrane protein
MAKGPIGRLGSVWRFVVDVALRWYHGRVGDLAASVTFWIVVSLPALVLTLLAVLGPLDQAISVGVTTRLQSEAEDFIATLFTGEARETVTRTVRGLFVESSSSLAIVSSSLTIWSISRGFAGLIRALEDIYDIEDRRPWYHARVVAVLLGLGTILMPVPLILAEIFLWSGFDGGIVETVLRTALSLVVLVLWASVLFHYGPAERHRWRLDLPGAVVAALGWWLLTFGFARYVTWTANANELRVAVGALLLALTWIWLAAQILLVGGAVNYLLGERLGVTRGRRSWSINDVVVKSTGEIRKIVVPERDGADGADPLPADAPIATVANRNPRSMNLRPAPSTATNGSRVNGNRSRDTDRAGRPGAMVPEAGAEPGSGRDRR